MKKIKLFTALATAGMTTGILLPLVTSCNVAATGEIKFKLGEGVTAKADPFKVGDKVVIKVTVEDEDVAISTSGITVKFDGWKVESSYKTWKWNAAKNTITIFNAPTTDITVQISAIGKSKPVSAKVSVTLKYSSNYVIKVDGVEIDDDYPLSVQAGTMTYQQLINQNNITAQDPNEALSEVDHWEFSDGSTVNLSSFITSDCTIKPIIIATEPVGEESYRIQVKAMPYGDESYSLGCVYDENGLVADHASHEEENPDIKLSELFNTFITNGTIVAKPGCKFTGKWFMDEGEEFTEIVGDPTIKDLIDAHGQDCELYAECVVDETGNYIGLMTYNSDDARFEFKTMDEDECEAANAALAKQGLDPIYQPWAEGDVVTLAFNTNGMSGGEVNQDVEASAYLFVVNNDDGYPQGWTINKNEDVELKVYNDNIAEQYVFTKLDTPDLVNHNEESLNGADSVIFYKTANASMVTLKSIQGLGLCSLTFTIGPNFTPGHRVCFGEVPSFD